jgi:multimeric flavodoxin WrbA
MAFDDFLTNGQSHAGAGIFIAGVQALEDDKNPIEESLVDADAIIGDRK